MSEHIHKTFEFDWEDEYFSNLLFGDYVHMNKEYCKIENVDALPNKFDDYLNYYNS